MDQGLDPRADVSEAHVLGPAAQPADVDLPEVARKIMTFDNGGEFARHRRLEDALGVAAYFCDPHAPWQRGTIENTNGILRRDMPRKTDITNYTARDISGII